MDRIMDTPNDGKVKVIVFQRASWRSVDQAAGGFLLHRHQCWPSTAAARQGFAQEKKALTEGADLVIVTPGRMLSHLTLRYVDLSSLEVLILDEADRMLDMGFHADIMRSPRTAGRQTCCSRPPAGPHGTWPTSC